MLSNPADNAEHTLLVKAISDIASAMPLVRTRQLYQLARFLHNQPLLPEEAEEIDEIIDDLLWNVQFSRTSGEALAALTASVEKEIEEGRIMPMFDEEGNFIEQQSDHIPPHFSGGITSLTNDNSSKGAAGS